MVKNTTRSSDDDVDGVETRFFFFDISSTSEKSSGKIVADTDDLKNLEGLKSEFTSGGKNDGADAGIIVPLFHPETLENGNQKRKSFTRASFGSTENIATAKSCWKSSGLNSGEVDVVSAFETLHGAGGDGKIGEFCWFGSNFSVFRIFELRTKFVHLFFHLHFFFTIGT